MLRWWRSGRKTTAPAVELLKAPALPKLSTFSGWLRCHRPTASNIIGETALALVAPRFALEWTDESAAEALASADKSIDVAVLQPRQHRRFAGYDLSRGAYHSLCRNKDGNDAGVLTAEIKAYRDLSDQSIIADVLEGALIAPGVRRSSATVTDDLLKEIERCVVLCIFPASKLRAALLQRPDFTPESVSPTTILDEMTDSVCAQVLISPSVDEDKIENIVDLRDFETRESFYECFRIGQQESSGPSFYRPLGDNISNFPGMIPELINFNLGGTNESTGGVTQAIGDFLRASGANGLIFPSARTDSVVAFDRGQMTDFGGWNFVDFRHSDRNPLVSSYVCLSPWPSEVLSGVRSRFAPGGRFAGSLAIEGVQEANDNLYEASYADGRRALLEELRNSRSMLLTGTHRLDLLRAT
jgi:hypothetical protein